MRQSISTKYVGPTNFRGSRIIATSASGHRVTVDYAHEMNVEMNHRSAAHKLAADLSWTGEWVGGATKDGYVFVQPDGDSFTIEGATK